MDEQTVKAIAAMAVSNSADVMPATDVPVVALPNDVVLHTLECYGKNPLSMKGVLQTSRIESFCAFADKNKLDSTGLFIHDNSLEANLVIDHGNSTAPGWGRYGARLELRKNSEYISLLSTDKQKMSQSNFIDFMRDYQHCLTFYKDADMTESMDFSTAVQSIQRIDVSTSGSKSLEHGDMNRARSAMEEIEISGTLRPPAVMVMTCEPYGGLPAMAFVCRIIAYFSSSDDIRIGYRIQAHNKRVDDMVGDFTDLLVGDPRMQGIDTYFGVFKK